MEVQKTPEPGQVANQQRPATIQSILSNESIKSRFADILGKRANAFMSSIISATKANPDLALCEPNTVISSAVIAATLDLPIQSNLGFAHIVPYNSKQGKQAQFQMGWKGFVQLALRTGQYKTINATEVYEGELVSYDRISGDVVLDSSKKVSEKIIGYVAFFRLLNGFEKHLYWTRQQVEAHGAKYSKSFKSDYGRWKLDFDAMAIKTVLKMLLSKYGILSVDMNTAIIADQSIVKNPDTMDVSYPDAAEQQTISSMPTPPSFEETTFEDVNAAVIAPNGLFDEQGTTAKTKK
jgi:recombination protein RecT